MWLTFDFLSVLNEPILGFKTNYHLLGVINAEYGEDLPLMVIFFSTKIAFCVGAFLHYYHGDCILNTHNVEIWLHGIIIRAML